ncbi:DNA polymerase delta small subunit Cdc1 [Coemansia sp. Benny D115]|nr:DNA polymerase delta small subunit Cdc1 [Coemansia sp. Benny D115]
MTGTKTQQLPRATIAREPGNPSDNVFRTGYRRTYTQQFDQLYHQRLQQLKPAVQQTAQTKWPKIKQTLTVLGVDNTAISYIIGTIFIDSPSKPSTLQQVENEPWISNPEIPEQGYRSDEHTVYLEDESGRIRLTGSIIDTTALASGVVAAALGQETPTGDFEVADLCYAGMAPQSNTQAIGRQTEQEDTYVALLSGLDIGADNPVTLQMQVLAELLCGNLGTLQGIQTRVAARVAQVVVLGNTLHLTPAPLGHAEDARLNDRTQAAQVARQVDDWLADIARCVPVHLVPGEHDPTDCSLPQQPLPRGLFAQSQGANEFQLLTNPAIVQLGQMQWVYSAGQNIDDLMRYRVDAGESACQVAARSLGWRHLAPSAPDTLWCYPFVDHDPFVLDSSPHVYAVGNQERFDTCVAQGDSPGVQTRVVMVPRFSRTGQAVLLNTRTLECTVLNVLPQ